ncbi:MAG: hypothetical protein P4M12_02450, partial [Gammaproteobacteria bacterium]|nr:hypothetical protein [Gammaproteobacteria bacterium]
YIVIPAEQIHKKHGSFWKLLTEVIVSSLALAAAPWAAPFLFTFAAGSLGAAVATGVTAGLLDAAMQGAACGVGLQDKFSISGVIETGVLGGFLAAAKGAAVANEARQAAATRTMLAMGKASVTSQLMEMSMGLRQKFDVKEVLTSMANGFANAKIEVPNTGQFAGRIVGNAVTTLTGTAITSLVYRQDPNLQYMAAQLLGSTIGSEAGQMLNETTERKAEPETKLPKTQNRQAHVEELAHAELPDGKIDVRDPRWKKQLSEMASEQRINRINHRDHQTQHEAKLTRAQRWSNHPAKSEVNNISSDDFSKLIHTKIGPQEKGLEPVYPEMWAIGAFDAAKLGMLGYKTLDTFIAKGYSELATDIGKLWSRGIKAQEATVKNSQTLNRFHEAAKNLSEEAQKNIRILRGWAKSKGWVKEPNPLGKPERWGMFENGNFTWRLRIKPESSMREGLDVGSNMPRFDARLGSGGSKYINPFVGRVGDEDVGTHVNLTNPYHEFLNTISNQIDDGITIFRRPL